MLTRLGILLLAGLPALRDDPPYELPPIRYSATAPEEEVARLPKPLVFDEDHGYLKSLLDALKIPVSSQMLVFSKTSLQAARISPSFPRAVYFNDDVYVGWVKGGEVMEISAVDPRLGAVFYTLAQRPDERPRRQTHACLQCHDSRGLTLGVPGHVVRSVYPAGDGLPQFHRGTHKIDYRSPFEERWGGWYVTGRHGDMKHLGNVVLPDAKDADLQEAASKGWNLDVLPPRVEASAYLTRTSDIVALMVLEHQAYVHNLLTRANHESRVAELQSADINRLLNTPGAGLTEGSRSRVRSACEPLVEALFFSEEPVLPSPVQGGPFAKDFEARGPFDRRGRSLRHFDLHKRLFRYPLSYLVYSKAFAGLPTSARDYVARRFDEILSGKDASAAFKHLSAEDRRVVREILEDTLPALLRP
jgi:hypothetical protein